MFSFALKSRAGFSPPFPLFPFQPEIGLRRQTQWRAEARPPR
jgi:hypothetical protein